MQLQHPISVAVQVFLRDFSPEEPFAEFDEPLLVPGTGIIRPGLALDQVELCTFTGKDSVELLEQICRLDVFLLEQGIGVTRFEPTRPAGGVRELRASRFGHSYTQSLFKPLYAPDEFGAVAAENLVGLADLCFTSMTFDVTGYTPEEQLLRLNLLNLAGPSVLRHLGYTRNQGRALWRYAVNQARVPGGWSWQADNRAYLETVDPLTRIFAYVAERAEADYLFANGLFHYATLLPYNGKAIIRLTVLPTLIPREVRYFVETIDTWLAQAVADIGSRLPQSAHEAASLVPPFVHFKMMADPAVRLYHAER